MKKMKHLISLSHYSKDEVLELIELAMSIKRGEISPDLRGKSLVLLFFNPSLRTRTSFELAMQQLGGNVVCLNAGEDTWKLEVEEGVVMDKDSVEHIKDAAAVLGRYADAIGIRAFPGGVSWEVDRRDRVIEAFVRYGGVPIINMESSLYHPNQALGDMMTIMERFGKEVRGIPITIAWANHPKPLPMAVPNSILLVCALFGMEVRLLHPQGYDLDSAIMEKAEELSRSAGGRIIVTDDFDRGFRDSKVVYAKSWGSIRFYSKKEEELKYRKSLKGWIVDDEKMAKTDSAFFMHCLPVRRNVVATDSVLDSDHSIIYDEAYNRLPAQKAVLSKLLGNDPF